MRNFVRAYIQNLNLFPSIPPSTNASLVRYQRITTAIFLILLIWLTIILFLYYVLIKELKFNRVDNPSYQKYLELYLQHSDSLSCPCRNTAIQYRKFIELNFTMHEICNSDYLNDDWIGSLPRIQTYIAFTADQSFTYFFKALLTFCQSSHATVTNALDDFYWTQYISTTMTSKFLLESQMDVKVIEFISATTASYTLLLESVRRIIAANGLFSAQRSNFDFEFCPEAEFLCLTPQKYGDCDCLTTPSCIETGVLWNENHALTLYKLPEYYIGCYIVEALMQSSLECFYTQGCIDQIFHRHFLKSQKINMTALHRSRNSRFRTNSSLNEIMNELMIENWNQSINHKNYFEQCVPYVCTYTLISRNSLVVTITIMIGLVGGLVKILKIIVPHLVKLMIVRSPSQGSSSGKKTLQYLRRVFSKI